ncbi:putative disease resistance protein [Senna tora]|uniref:Putative disease resistance protein n=1 Tax=Senna tora TaxID=362788 RepID=A0A834XA96_9FABA|nr:putative disease resistance protein [Senna tora]
MGACVSSFRMTIATLWRHCLLLINSTPTKAALMCKTKYLTRPPIIEEFMETLAHSEAHIIGVYGLKDAIQDRFIPKLLTRIDRDKVFDVILTVTVTNKCDVKKIQDEIAGQLGFNFDNKSMGQRASEVFNFNKKSKGERASELLDRIKAENKILIILLDLYKAVDLVRPSIVVVAVLLSPSSSSSQVASHNSVMGDVVASLRMTFAALWRLLRYNSTPKEDPDDYYVKRRRSRRAKTNNSNYIRMPILDDFMNALAIPQTHLIGVCGSNNDVKHSFIPKVLRRIDRDKAFDVVLSVTVKRNTDVKQIQNEIAGQLGFNFNKKSKGERACELLDRIRQEKNILIMLLHVYKALDLGEIGIPFGEHHEGCKILISSSDLEMFHC